MNGATATASAADISSYGKNLTVNGTVSAATGLDGGTYANTFDGSTTYLKSTDALFNVTGAFTMGGWFYRSSWAAVGSLQYLLGSIDEVSPHGYALRLTTSGNLELLFYATAQLSVPYTALSAGWHHFVAVWASSTSYAIYVDGVATTGSTSWPLAAGSTADFEVGAYGGGNGKFSGRMADVFFHSGTAYNVEQVRALYSGTKGAYFNSKNLSTAQDSVTMSWSPWSKQYCTTSCTSAADTGFTYYIYRYVEPPKVDIRTTIPWAIQTSGSYGTVSSYLTGANATGMPLDPLATDANGNLLCSNSSTTTPMCVLVANIAGSSCNSSTPGNCTFTDSASLSNGFNPQSIYNYIMVVRDGDGNYTVPKVQRYRSPYFTSDFSQGATAAFRTEQRWRRVAPFLVDENYQQAQTVPQIMVHVPMDVSGLDHDFFMQKYEASKYSGTISNNTPAGASAWPLQASGTAAGWLNNAGSCYDSFLRNGTFSLSGCGDGSSVDSTSAVMQSKQGTGSLASVDQGAFWMACRNSGVADGAGNSYYEHLATDPEWLKAADWGDTDQSGYVRTGYLTANGGGITSNAVGTIESGNGTNGYCNTNGAGYSTSASTNTQYCRSRYGAADMVGGAWEWTTGQVYSGSGYDNGIDGLWRGRTINPGCTASTVFPGYYDLLRGSLATASTGATVSVNSDYCIYNSGLMGAFRGGQFNAGAAGGRWALFLGGTSTSVGGRCAL